MNQEEKPVGTIESVFWTFLLWIFLFSIIASIVPYIRERMLNPVMPRGMTSFIQSDFRTLSAALETYKLDHQIYPPSDLGELVPNILTTPYAYLETLHHDLGKEKVKGSGFLQFISHIALKVILLDLIMVIVYYSIYGVTQKLEQGKRTERQQFAPRIFILTLLFQLIAFYQIDSFLIPNSQFQGQDKRYFYASTKETFIIQSVGPDGIQDQGSLKKLLASHQNRHDLMQQINLVTYDPTNGLISSGDFFRISEIQK